MNGEYGTRIDDGYKIDGNDDDNQHQSYTSATVLEGSHYQVYVQLDCGNSWTNPCSQSLSVMAWIDYNDNGYDDGESFVLRPEWSDQKTPTGQYVGDARIPMIDSKNVRTGIHTMRITIGASDEYKRRCGNVGYQETQDYTVNVVPRVIGKF